MPTAPGIVAGEKSKTVAAAAALAVLGYTQQDISAALKGVDVESLPLELPGPEELQYRALWQEFFRTVSIRERTNPRCQNAFLPKRDRGVMTEFLPVDYEGLSRPAAAGDLPAPGAPAGISAPGTPPGSGPSAPGSAP